MSRISDVEERLLEWVSWRGAGKPAGARGSEIETAIDTLPGELRQTVMRHYLSERAEPRDAADAPEWIVSRRLGRVHRLLADWLRAKREEGLLLSANGRFASKG